MQPKSSIISTPWVLLMAPLVTKFAICAYQVKKNKKKKPPVEKSSDGSSDVESSYDSDDVLLKMVPLVMILGWFNFKLKHFLISYWWLLDFLLVALEDYFWHYLKTYEDIFWL